MSILNKAHGNMYEWVTHTWSPITGCMHQCQYCYVWSWMRRYGKGELPNYPTLRKPYPKLGKGKTIFVGHQCDMFAGNVPLQWIDDILEWCLSFPDNDYVFQTKNPQHAQYALNFPERSMIGTTIETNRDDLIQKYSKAPVVDKRVEAMQKITNLKKFVTIEPVLDFDVYDLARLVAWCAPKFVNIGADSKGHGLIEPHYSKILEFVAELKLMGIEVREKRNLERLKP